MLAKVLQAKLDPPTPDLAEIAATLTAKGNCQLSTECVEDVLMAKLGALPLAGERLKYLIQCSRGCDDVRRDSHRYSPGVMEELPKVQQMISNYSGLSITCPELFGLDPLPAEMAAATVKDLWGKKELPLNFLTKLADAAADQAEEIFGPLLSEACLRLKGRNLMEQRSDEVNWIGTICATKGPLARLLVTLPAFLPPKSAAPAAANPFMAMMGGASGASGSRPQQPSEGFRLQNESLLGWVLAPTCIDTALYKDKSARQIHFQNLTRKTQGAVQGAQNLLRSSLSDIMQQAGSIVNPLLRSGDATREQVLLWFGALITGTESRTKSANTLDQGGGPNHFLDTMENGQQPQLQNLDMRLQMQIMQAQMTGFATPGMALNTLWCLLELAKPIPMKQVKDGSLDPFYVLRDGAPHDGILGGFREEARFGDSDEVEAAKKSAEAKGLLSEAPKFTTQIFWLALRAVHVLLAPVLKEELCFAVAAGYFQTKNMAKMEQCLGEHFLHQTILESDSWITSLAALLNLEMAFCLSAALPHKAAEIAAVKVTGTVIADEVSPQWSALPSCILEDLIETIEYYINITPPGQRASALFTHLNADLLLLLVTFMLGSGNHVKNPNLRGKATTILMSLAKQQNYLQLLETSPVLANDIIPGCIRVFTAVEKTKQSYYDIRMQLKYQLRIPIMELFEKVLHLEAHKKTLKSFAVEHSDEFLKFLNQMMNDATMQLEEGLDTLVDIRRVVREEGEAGLQRPAADQLNQDEQTDGGEDVYRRSRADPKEHCKTYMKMGNRTIRTLWSISREAPMVIVGKPNVLQQLLHNCLNACLDRLVGPRCLELKMQKGKAQDFEEYNFKPKELLQFIAEMYVFVGRADKERVQKMITEDGRSYKAKTFGRAVQILKREQMISSNILKEFETFVQELNTLAASQEAALANITIPDNYLDPIMSEIMEDPVLLPTSKNVMDRKVIERHIMSNDDDPFNRLPLKMEDLVPQTELKAEIQGFCSKHGIVLGGSDD